MRRDTWKGREGNAASGFAVMNGAALYRCCCGCCATMGEGSLYPCHPYTAAPQVTEEGAAQQGVGGPMRADAAVNCGNALCSWAELPGVEPPAAAQLLLQAVAAYQGALAQEGEADAAVGGGWGGG